jgi:alkylation response protein AidB-like acyl-CoA dehydrogenase
VTNTNEDLSAYRSRVRAWLTENLDVRDPAAKVESRSETTMTAEIAEPQRALQRRIFEAGFAGITWPREYGGQGLDDAYQRIFNEEAAGFVTPDLGVAGHTSIFMIGPTMLAHASPEFNRRHLPRILSGDELWVEFFSEPGAGSDLAGVTTRATRDGDHWLLTGSKIWSSGAHYADYGMCLARTNWDVPKHRGLTWFAVSTKAPGVDIQPIREISGEVNFCQEFFEEVRLTDDDVIGEVDNGWPVARTMLVFERGVGGPETPIDQHAGMPLAPDLVALARSMGTDADPVVRQLIARAHTLDYVQAALERRVGDLVRRDWASAGAYAAYAKLGSGVNEAERARIGMEIAGAGGVVWKGDQHERRVAAINYLNGRIIAIAGGTNEMQRNGIGEGVLGLPREPAFDLDKPFAEVLRNARNWSPKST